MTARQGSNNNPTNTLTVLFLAVLTMVLTASVVTGTVLLGMAGKALPEQLPGPAEDYRPVTPEEYGYLQLTLESRRLGTAAEATYPAQARARDIRSGNLGRMLEDAAVRRGWRLHLGNMLLLPAQDLPELERAAADLSAWLLADAAGGGEPRPPSDLDLVNVRLEIERQGAQRTWIVVGAIFLGTLGGLLCAGLLYVTVEEANSNVRARARTRGQGSSGAPPAP